MTTKTQWPHADFDSYPANLTFVTSYEPGIYDIAILHIDQQAVLNDSYKRQIYLEFNEFILDIPKIVINHGSPVYPDIDSNSYNQKELKEICIQSVKELVGQNQMVVNSHTAASEKEWGFGMPIVHGINPVYWKDLLKEPRVFTALSAGGFDQYYNRYCLNEVKRKLLVKGYTLWHAKDNIDTGKSKKYYRKFLGSSLLYLDTSFRTPMNRARTEAMLSGCCVIQVEGAHDLERWAKPNENIILVPNNTEQITKMIISLLENGYQEALRIGQKGKETAMEMFGPERYRNEWLALLKNTIARK